MSLSLCYEQLKAKYPHQPTFLQAAGEIIESLHQYEAANDLFSEAMLARIGRLLEPERSLSFRVDWVDDAGNMQSNTGYRVQYNSALGPYKGGLRFDPSVNEDILKFLGFEQIFKNALTGLPLGAGKGGSDFDPKGKSDNEIKNFCTAFMTALHHYIGIDVDVPAGDIGVGAREIGYLYGAYKKIVGTNEGVLSGKDPIIGGSLGRTEATGHGVVYFTEAIAKQHGLILKGMRAVVSGSGNVAEHTARKLVEYGVVVLTLSDRHGYLYKEAGLTNEDINHIHEAKQSGTSLAEVTIAGAKYVSGTPWQSIVAEAYFPCATQNEVNEDDARAMLESARIIVEGANMPLTEAAVALVRKHDVYFAPGKAANAGGVTVSGLEMVQNASHYPWTSDRVEEELKRTMQHIHDQCARYGKDKEGDVKVDYVRGANIAGFVRVITAMERLGW